MDSRTSLLKTTTLCEAEPFVEQPPGQNGMSTVRKVFLISSLNATVTVANMNTGMLTVNLEHMGKDLHMDRALLLWPALVYSLACGCSLLLAGAVADVIGNRTINLIGTFTLSVFILASGLATSGMQFILFRIFQGIGLAMCFPTAVSILSAAFPQGRIRNIAFGCLGLGTPLGFAIGILLGGWVQTVGVGWRVGFYAVAGVTMALFAVNCWGLPYDEKKVKIVWRKLKTDVDWIGVVISSTSMALLSYSLAQMSGNLMNIMKPANMLLLIISFATIPLFVLWMHVQEARKKPALIPNSLWKNSTFSAICAMVLLSWATLQSLEWFISLFYQQVQHLNPIETAIRYLPNVTAGATLNILTGLIVHRVWVNYYVVGLSALCALAPLLMAIVDVSWSFWWCLFWVMLLLPISVDVNFTVANLVITDIFPKETQAIAGGVYQAVSQLGISIGIAVMAVVSNNVTDKSSFPDKQSPEALLKGFRAVFWACFGMMIVSTLVGMWGLRGRRNIGKRSDPNQQSEKAETPTQDGSQSSGGSLKRHVGGVTNKLEFKKKPAPIDTNHPKMEEKRRSWHSLGSPKLPPLARHPFRDSLAIRVLEAGIDTEFLNSLYGRIPPDIVETPRYFEEF